MIKRLLFVLLILPLALFGQTNNFKWLKLSTTDTTAFAISNGVFWKSPSSGEFFFWENGTLKRLGGAGSGSNLYFKNGLTKQADSTTVKLGGLTTNHTYIQSPGYGVFIGSDSVAGMGFNTQTFSGKRAGMFVGDYASGFPYSGITFGESNPANGFALVEMSGRGGRYYSAYMDEAARKYEMYMAGANVSFLTGAQNTSPDLRFKIDTLGNISMPNTNTLSLSIASSTGTNGQVLTSDGTNATWEDPTGGSGTVTTVGFTGGLISVANPTTTPAFTVSGTSGGIPYFSSSSTWATSTALAANALVIGGGSGAAPSTTTTGTGVLTALGVNVGSAGAFTTFNGAGGTPSTITLTNGTGLPISGITGLGTGVGTWLATPSWTNFASLITGTAPYVALTGTSTATGTMTLALGSNPFIRTSGVTTGTGATSGIQSVFNSLTTGVGSSYETSSLSSGTLLKATSTSVVIDHTEGSGGLISAVSSGANSTSAKHAIGISSVVTNTGTLNSNVALYLSASGGSFANYGLWSEAFVGGDYAITHRNSSSAAAAAASMYFNTNSGQIGRISAVSLNSSAYGGANSFNIINMSANPLTLGTSDIVRLNISAAGSFVFTLPVTTGTGSTAGAQFLGNSLTTGNIIDASSTTLTSGVIIKASTTSTVINHTAGTNALGWFEMSGANSTSSKTAIAFTAKVTNTGTSSTNTAGLFRSSGATVNNSLDLVGAILLTSSAGTSGDIMTSAGAGATPTWTTPVSVSSSTYTPSLTNTTNVAASTAYVTGYYRVGNSVTVYGKVDIDVSLAASSATELQIALPIASNMTSEEDLGGTAISDSVASLTARIKGDATTDKASVVFKAISLSNDSYSFEFSYQVK